MSKKIYVLLITLCLPVYGGLTPAGSSNSLGVSQDVSSEENSERTSACGDISSVATTPTANTDDFMARLDRVFASVPDGISPSTGSCADSAGCSRPASVFSLDFLPSRVRQKKSPHSQESIESPIRVLHKRVQAWLIDGNGAFVEQGYLTPGSDRYIAHPTDAARERIIRVHSFPRIIDQLILERYCYSKVGDKKEYLLFGEILPAESKPEKGSFGYAVNARDGICYHRCFSSKYQLPRGVTLPPVDKKSLARLNQYLDTELYDLEVQENYIIITDKETRTQYKIYFLRHRANTETR